MPDLSTVPLGPILGGGVTIGGLAFIIRMVIHYQRDFTEQYREALRQQAERIAKLEERVGGLQKDRETLQGRLIACNQERAALRVLVRQAGLAWNPNDWLWDDDPGNPGTG